MQKHQLRQHAKSVLSGLSLEARQLLERRLLIKLQEFLSQRPEKLWAVYFPMKHEPNIAPLWEASDRSLKNWVPSFCFPLVSEQSLRFYVPESFTGWSKSNLGVWEPDPKKSKEVTLQEIQGVLVPGVAFDSFGHRLGQGMGFYDRTLQTFTGVKVGVLFSCQLFPEIPSESHDISMDYLITEEDILCPAELEK